MKQTKIDYTYLTRLLAVSVLAMVISTISGCLPEDPEKEDVPEIITNVTLTFTPAGVGSVVTAFAVDPDGAGIKPLAVIEPIALKLNTTYTMDISLINELAAAATPEYDISAEVEEEGDEHMFFFSWTNNVFADPAGNGNVDNRSDDVNYLDDDNNGLPLGLVTSWTSANAVTGGDLRIVLKHQPELKTATSEFTAGETDLDIVFNIIVK